MSSSPLFNQPLAVFLADVCKQAYVQYLRNGEFTLPDGFRLVQPLSISPPLGQPQELFGFIIQSDTQIIIAFRGSQTAINLVSDLNLRQSPWPYSPTFGRVHSGFLDLYASCREQIHRALATLPATSELLITGHSLGGALAEYCAFDVAVNTSFKPILYNFGSPRSGSWLYARAYNKAVPHSVRLVVNRDIIPQKPPILLFSALSFPQIRLYWHTGTEWLLQADGGSILGHHDLDTYLRGLDAFASS